MDPASFSFAVVGMFLTCCKGYKIFSDTYKAPADAQEAARRIRAESDYLLSWGEHYEVRPELREDQISEKLGLHVMGEYTRNGIFNALGGISETFTDVKRLNKKYRITVDYHRKGDRSPHMPKDVRDFLNGQTQSRSSSPRVPEKEDEKMKRDLGHFKYKMSLLEKCRWSLQDKARIDNLIEDLQRYNGHLVRFCHLEAIGQINRSYPTFTVPRSANPIELYRLADIAEEAARDITSPMAEGRQMTATMARFKARLLTPLSVSNKRQYRWRLLDIKDYNVLSTSHAWSLGISLQSQDSVFVEWWSFIDETGQPDELAEEQIHELGDFLTIPHRPNEFRALDCVGLFKDKSSTRYGVVYALPEHLRSVRTKNRRIYNPSSLTDLMHNANSIIDLGLRFQLAKKLIYSVVVLHTCGWLHKNISPDNILFFPARPAEGERVKEYRKDVGRPIIVGYGLSRPDDVIEIAKVSRGPGRLYSRQPYGDDDNQPTFNIYQHPDKATSRDRRFRHSYDIYSIGMVLLEIGLWQSLNNLELSRWKDAYSFRQFVLERLVPDLWGQCGSIYGNVVKECLTLNTNDLALAEEGQRRLAWNIAKKLDSCAA